VDHELVIAPVRKLKKAGRFPQHAVDRLEKLAWALKTSRRSLGRHYLSEDHGGSAKVLEQVTDAEISIIDKNGQEMMRR